ncbi:MAG: hypothetical protein K8L91_12790 [Anaerolineae bacterium]|nr:hypothetical protein [Anaerolineae bacterium]
MNDLYDLVQQGEGNAAVQQVAEFAQVLGGWGPAPGDEVVFDPYMDRDIRGAAVGPDYPAHCYERKDVLDRAECIEIYQTVERQVRFGRSLFTTPNRDGTETLRPKFDDLLSTFIEEVGHSWQEYLYETDGQGGPRIRETSQAEAERWRAGQEYQVKRYILNLDGDLFTLSDQQRETLQSQICEGYANPMNHEVPPYEAPPSWLHSDRWPLTVPSTSEFDAFCHSANLESRPK